MGPGASDIAAIIPDLREKLPDLELPPDLGPEQARFRLFDSITTFFRNSARTQPLVIILDDLHWADPASLLLLEFVAREMADCQLLVVGAYRDVELSRSHPLPRPWVGWLGSGCSSESRYGVSGPRTWNS